MLSFAIDIVSAGDAPLLAGHVEDGLLLLARLGVGGVGFRLRHANTRRRNSNSNSTLT